jgi:small subunit ribosomal protein S6
LTDRRRQYELVFALTPVANESEAAVIVEGVSDYVSNQGGEVTEQEVWGIRRLSYPIRNFQEGNYVRALVSLNSSSVASLEHSLQANEDILTHMVSRI